MPFGDTPAFDRGIDRGVMMPVGELITSALSNKGNPTGILQDNTFRVQNAQEVRIVDKNGEVLFSGVGPDAARQAVAVGQNLSDTLGNKAGWTIQTGERTINTDGSVGPMRYFDVANEKVNKSVLGKIADIALPVAASFIPGVGPVLGAAIGSTASSVAQGRSFKDTLLRAGLSAGGAAAGGAILGNAAGGGGATVGSNLPSFGALAAPYAAGAAGATAGSVAGSAAGNLVDDIIVTALNKAAPSVLGPAVTGGISNTLLDRVISQPTPASQPAQPQPVEAGPEIVATAQNILPSSFTTPEALAASAAANALNSTVAQSPETTQGMTQQEIEDITMAGAGGGGLFGNLTANMNLVDYLQLASLVGSAGAGLLGGGGGGSGTAVPYVSPFGPGMGAGGMPTGPSRQLNPTIADYERYGFGPEALFFAPQSNVVAPTTTGPASAMVNPQYVPLI